MSKNNFSTTSSSLLFGKYFFVVLGAMLVLIVMIGIQFFLRPLYGEIQAKRQSEILSAESDLSLRRSHLQQLEESAKLYRSIKLEELARVFEMVPADSGEGELYAEMEALLGEKGFQLKSVSVSDGGEETIPESGLTVKTLNLNLSASGDSSYEGFKTLLAGIEQHLRILDLSSVSYLPNQGDYILNLKTYYQD